jgi:hypothetical protein
MGSESTSDRKEKNGIAAAIIHKAEALNSLNEKVFIKKEDKL